MPLFEESSQIVAFDIFHHHIRNLFLFAQIVNDANVRMVQRGRCPDDPVDFFVNVGKSGGLFQSVELDDLDRYGPPDHRIEGFVNGPYRTFPNLLDYFEAADRVFLFRHDFWSDNSPELYHMHAILHPQ